MRPSAEGVIQARENGCNVAKVSTRRDLHGTRAILGVFAFVERPLVGRRWLDSIFSEGHEGLYTRCDSRSALGSLAGPGCGPVLDDRVLRPDSYVYGLSTRKPVFQGGLPPSNLLRTFSFFQIGFCRQSGWSGSKHSRRLLLDQLVQVRTVHRARREASIFQTSGRPWVEWCIWDVAGFATEVLTGVLAQFSTSTTPAAECMIVNASTPSPPLPISDARGEGRKCKIGDPKRGRPTDSALTPDPSPKGRGEKR